MSSPLTQPSRQPPSAAQLQINIKDESKYSTLSAFLNDGPSPETLAGLISCHNYSPSRDCGQRQDAAGERQADRGVDQNAEAEPKANRGDEEAAGARQKTRTRSRTTNSGKNETRTK